MTAAAVVVTYNRHLQLRRCIAALLAQTYPLDAIYIVDNGSTDGTLAYLASCLPPIQPILLPNNAGSAGGQAAGIRRAYADGHEWLWCSDDDGYPNAEALEHALAQARVPDRLWVNSLVISSIDPSKLSFGLWTGTDFITTPDRAKDLGACISGANPFNGTLLNRRVVAEIGVPCPELFIRGDEVEYQARAKRAGIQAYTATSSTWYHPPVERVIHLPPSAFVVKGYYAVRNSGATVSPYGDLRLSGKGALKKSLRLIRHMTIDSFLNLYRCYVIVRAVVAAFRNDVDRVK